MSALHYIAGPPGTGKTTTLVRHTTRAVEAHGKHAVCIASMTKTAANHIAEQAANALGQTQQLPDDAVGTLHAHAYRAIGSPDLAETPEGLRAWNSEHPARRIHPGGLNAPDDDTTTPGATLVHAQVMAHRNRQTPEALWTQEQREHHQAWEDYKNQTFRLDFTDLIQQAATIHHPAYPRVWLIDEAQDLSTLELRLAHRWIRDADVGVLVGDTDQALFTWRGADPDALQALPYDTVRALEQSHRVPHRVHAAAQAWIRRCSHRTDVAYHPTAAAGDVTQSPHTLRTPDLVASLAAQAAEHGTVMVLAATRRLLGRTVRELADAGVPFHNPYRPSARDWNPLAAGRPLVTYTRAHQPDLADWTWQDLADWTDPLDGRRALAPNAKSMIDLRCTKDRFGESDQHQTVDLRDLLSLLGCSETDMRHPVLRGDVDWYERNLKPSERRRMQPAIDLAKRHGSKVLHETPRVIVGTVHCSPPDEPILTKRGQVPIAELHLDDRLVGYHRGTNCVLGGMAHGTSKGYAFERSVRPYVGDLVVIETERSRTRVTPNHRVIASFDDSLFDSTWVVYLMRAGDWWRIGTCVSGHRPYRAGGLGGRLATEQADVGWILSVHDDRRSALIAEATAQGQYGIPGLTFRASKERSVDDEDLAAIHNSTAAAVGPRARALLEAHGLSEDWPLYSRAPLRGEVVKRNMRGNFVTEAANLVALTGYVRMLTTCGERKGTPLRATVTTEPYEGPVYGIDVPPHHHYISGGAVVHNSVKGGEADTVVIAPDTSRAAHHDSWAYGARHPRRDPLLRLGYVGLTRARDKVILLQPSGPEFLPLRDTIGAWA